MTVRLVNYESYERRFRDQHMQRPSGVGEWDHFDLLVFRNAEVIGGNAFELIEGRSLETKGSRVGCLEIGQSESLREFLSDDEPTFSLAAFRDSTQLLSLLLRCSALERKGLPPYLEADFHEL